ncbi:hypothetical protein Ancab_003767 [Ancistrocladus abbreviatus]
MRWPAPGLRPGAVGRKSSNMSVLLAMVPLLCFELLLGCGVEEQLVLTASGDDDFDFKCLPSMERASWHKIKTTSNAK